jgi:hypothetical protein
MKNRKEIAICSKVMVVSMFRVDCGVWRRVLCWQAEALLDFRVNKEAARSSQAR